MFRSRGGGGVSDFTTIEGRSQTSVFFRSPLDQKEAIGVVFRSMDPPQAILEPRRVRVTLIPGSTLRGSGSDHVETKSKPANLHRRGTREKSGILNINTPIFLTPPQEKV